MYPLCKAHEAKDSQAEEVEIESNVAFLKEQQQSKQYAKIRGVIHNENYLTDLRWYPQREPLLHISFHILP